MGLREAINRNAGFAIGAAAVLVVIAVVVVLRAGRTQEAQPVAGATGISHYTIDDGATWFADRMDKIPPFKKDGKDAVRAYVYRDASGKEFVSHMERYTPEALRALAALATMTPEQRGLEDPASLAGGLEGIEVKRPKETTWVRASEPRAQQIMQPRSPDGKRDGLQFVVPR